jgi:hypothetical protein
MYMYRNKKIKFYDLLARRKRTQGHSLLRDVPTNGSEADRFLLNGAPHPSSMQRAAAWIFGAWFIAIGIVFVDVARGSGSFPVVVAASICLLLGFWIFRNGFARKGPG